MKKFILILMGIAVLTSLVIAENPTNLYKEYLSIANKETNAVMAEKQARQYMASLSKTQFLEFVREAVKEDPHYASERYECSVGMLIFADIYMKGPGKNEPLLETLKQLSDTTLPSTWRKGLLDALRLNRRDLNEKDREVVMAMLREMGENKSNSDVYRSVCLDELGAILFNQREIITQKAPELKDVLEKQDRAALPKRDDADVKQAAILIDAIRDYKAALQKTADEVKDEQIKANLKKRLTKRGTAIGVQRDSVMEKPSKNGDKKGK